MADEKTQEPVSKQPPSGEVKPGDQETELSEKELEKASGGATYNIGQVQQT